MQTFNKAAGKGVSAFLSLACLRQMREAPNIGGVVSNEECILVYCKYMFIFADYMNMCESKAL